MHKPHRATHQSIVVRTTLALAAIILLALISMLGALYLAEIIEGDAAAINKAGSLRMQAYRLAWTLQQAEAPATKVAALIQQFEDTLHDPLLASRLNALSQTDPGGSPSILQDWSQTLRPSLPDQAQQFVLAVPAFVERIDQQVAALAAQSEQKVHALRALQGITLFATLLLAFFVVYGIHTHLAEPMSALVAMARRIGQGDFSERAHYQGDDELGLLAETMNQMSLELSSLYRDLENKVAEKTQRLRHANAVLSLLFDAARRLQAHPNPSQALLRALLVQARDVLQAGPLTLCLSRAAAHAAAHAAEKTETSAYEVIHSDQASLPDYCLQPACDQCPARDAAETRLVNFPLQSHQHTFGTLTLDRIDQTSPLQGWQSDLLRALAGLFSSALAATRWRDQQSRLALMEERAVIARELHDSLAQALSYQKMQIARLARQLDQAAPAADLQATLSDIQTGVSSAYRQLRELLSTFRLQANAPGLEAAIAATRVEFSQHSGLQIHLDDQLGHCPLTPNEEIHCLQIIREALSNVLKHAQAQNAFLKLHQTREGDICIQVTDDGIGFTERPAQTGHYEPGHYAPGHHAPGHYGLAILSERAHSLGGSLSMRRTEQGGTQVLLRFRPGYLNHQTRVEPT